MVLIGFLKNIFLNIKYFYKHSYHDLQKYPVLFPLLELVFHVNVSYAYSFLCELYKKSGINTDRLIEFLEKYITTKFKNKLIILDNACSHRNEIIKELVNKHNNILYAVLYQHFTNSIENYFSMLKSRLQKLDGLTHEKLKENIEKVIKDIPKEKYENIFKGAYNRTEKYVKKPSNRTRKLKKYLP